MSVELLNAKPHPVWGVPEPLGRAEDGRGIFRLVNTWGSVLRPDVRTVLLGPAELHDYLLKRAGRIAKAKDNPLWYGYEPQHWADADMLLTEAKILCLFGGNRAGKTEWCIKRAMQLLATEENVDVLFLQNNDLSSKQLHQKTAWKYMPPEWRNLRRNQEGNIKYDPKNGFSENIFTTPLGGTAIFGNYGQELDKYEGLSFNRIVPDENLSLMWYQSLLRGLATRGGSMTWAFTPIDGMTPAIAEVAGGARTRVSRPVDPRLLDPNERHVKDCPVGEMPYIAEKGKVRAIYFHSDLNPFGGYENLVELYGAADKAVRERRFYGFARKLVRAMFPKFGAVNILDDEAMEAALARGVTWYHLADPAGARNMYQAWVGVDRDGNHFINREWPDVEKYGEWAVPSPDAKRWDGAPGPAQPTLGLGVVDYKRLILELEGWKWTENGWEETPETEEIFERIMDPRSGAAQTVAERDGGASLMDRFEEEQLDREGRVEGPSMIFVPAPGLPESEGINGNNEGVQGINDLLAYDESRPITPLLNSPRLFIRWSCKSMIWAFLNYTGNDGAKAACKDPIDIARYMATSKLEYQEALPEGWGRPGYY